MPLPSWGLSQRPVGIGRPLFSAGANLQALIFLELAKHSLPWLGAFFLAWCLSTPCSLIRECMCEGKRCTCQDWFISPLPGGTWFLESLILVLHPHEPAETWVGSLPLSHGLRTGPLCRLQSRSVSDSVDGLMGEAAGCGPLSGGFTLLSSPCVLRGASVLSNRFWGWFFPTFSI